MSDNEDFFRERRAQAVLKHEILKRYPTVFAAKAGQRRPVVFLDGYAGRGEYEDGSPGSPVLLAQAAANLAGFRSVTGIYVEESRKDYLHLKEVLARHGRTDDPVLHGDVQDHLPTILARAHGAAFFAFLDPFGPALDREHLVGSFLRRGGPAPVEVLLHVSVSSVARLGGLFRRRREEGKALSPAEKRSVQHLDRFLGETWWQEYFEPVRGVTDEERATDAALRVADRYRAELCAATGFQSVSMPIRRRPDQLPKYILVLFTRHMDGLWHFADTLGAAGRVWHGAWQRELWTQQRVDRSRKAPAGWDPLFEPEPEPFNPDGYEKTNRQSWEDTIAGNIQRTLRRRGPMILAQHVDEVYGELLGAAGQRHVRAAVKALYRQGVVDNPGTDSAGSKFFRRMTSLIVS